MSLALLVSMAPLSAVSCQQFQMKLMV